MADALAAEPARERAQVRFIDIAQIGAGLAAYAYVVGGAITYLRLEGANVPPSAALSFVPGRQLLVVGVSALVVAGPLAFLLLWFLRGLLTKIQAKRSEPSRFPNLAQHLLIAFAVAGWICGPIVFVGVLFNEQGWWEDWMSAVAIGSWILLILIGAVYLTRVLTTRVGGLIQRSGEALYRPLAIFTLALAGGGALLAAYLYPMRAQSAIVRTSNDECVAGAYISEDGQGVHLIGGDDGRVVTVGKEGIVAVELGNKLVVEDISIRNIGCPETVGGVSAR
jgi:hypothetical protein